MATNVVVIDSAARRAVVKTGPGTYLSDVLSEACSKLGVNSSQYSLKHNNKQVDLSRTIRLSGLSSGAKLELVQLSKSAGVVSIALQLPPSEATPAQARLTDKFPSTTTLWLLLRKFEAGVAGGTQKKNFTARGSPSTGSGAGRLYYEQPVLNIMGRELSTFTDLQRTLAQLGFNSGSALIKLSYKLSETPLEEAMAQIQAYFDEVDPPAQQTDAEPSSSSSAAAAAAAEVPSQKEEIKPEWLEDQQMQDVESSSSAAGAAQVDTARESDAMDTQASASDEPNAIVADRPVSVYRPPSSAGPMPVRHNENDYVPTVEHAQIHQKLLQQESRNKRLPTDAELLAKQKEQKEELAKIENIEIKVRFPDQSAVSSKFGQSDSAATLYKFVRDCLDEKVKSEPFLLRNPGIKEKDGGLVLDNGKRLIMDLQLKGRVLVVFSWDDSNASATARGTKQVLRADLRQQAKEYIAPEMPGTPAEDSDDRGVKVDLGPKKDEAKEGGVKGKMPKWLKGLGKK